MRSEMRGHAARLTVPTTARMRALLEHRLCELVTTKLAQMEAGVASGKLTSEDFARDARPVISMLGSVRRIGTQGADADEQQRKSPERVDEVAIERLRSEIMERFERIKRRRQIEGGSE
jgi:hypothetical protein